MKFLSKNKKLILTSVLVIAGLCSLYAVIVTVNAYMFSIKPNVLLIVVDTLRADHMGCYGYSRKTTPHIDSELAEKGAVFLNAFTQSPWTKPAMGALFTSLYPHDAQMNNKDTILPDEFVTLAEALKKKGYHTVSFHTAYWASKIFNTDQGFDEYHELIDLNDGSSEPAPAVTARFIEWIEKNQDKKYFAYLHYMDPHKPYLAPREFNAMFVADPSKLPRPMGPRAMMGGWNPYKPKSIDRGWELEASKDLTKENKQRIINYYDAEIRFTDDALGRLFSKLKELDIMDDTLIIFTADHGEEFWEHGTYEHGHTLYNEIMRIPLIIRYNKNINPQKVNALAGLIDIYPTIMDIVNLPSSRTLKGISLMPALVGNAAPRSSVFCEGILANRGIEKNAVIGTQWKLIDHIGSKNRELELYDLSNNPIELENVVAQNPAIVSDMKREIAEWQKDQVKLEKDIEFIVPEEYGVGKFHSLGYVQ